MNKLYITLFGLMLCLAACQPAEPKQVNVGTDQCAFCRMTLMSPNFACQTITTKGKIYMYDDLKCQLMDENMKTEKEARFYVANYYNGNEFIAHRDAQFVYSEELKTPMAGHVAAVKTAEEKNTFIEENGGKLVEINDVFR